jgi:hypothetical protein
VNIEYDEQRNVKHNNLVDRKSQPKRNKIATHKGTAGVIKF